MEIYCYVMLRDRWFSQCLLPDARTSCSSFQHYSSQAVMIRALQYVAATGGAAADLEQKIRQWSRGGISIELLSDRKNMLMIGPQFLKEISHLVVSGQLGSLQ